MTQTLPQRMERFRTLSRQHPEFSSYLDGGFSKTHRALPVRSMNVETSREEVTFEIVPLQEIRRPTGLRLVWTLVRPASLGFSLGPMLVVLLYARAKGIFFDPVLAGSGFLSVFLFHTAMNVWDDYFDHRRGRDRLNPRGGSRAIQKGWVRARSLWIAGLVLVVSSILIALPLVLSSPKVIFVMAAFALGTGVAYSNQALRLKSRGGGEIATFLLAGPLLTTGFAWAVTHQVSFEYFVLGCGFGFTAVLYYHLKNIENILLDSQTATQTLAARLGFDAAKKWVWVFIVLSIGAICTFGWLAAGGPLFYLLALGPLLVLVPAANRLARAPSPLSSELCEIRLQGLQAHWMSWLSLAVAFGFVGL